MKKFILNTAFFLFILFLFFLLLILLPSKEMNTYNLNNDIEIVFIGDSHIQCAIQDDLFNNAKSLAINSESTYFSYYKIEKLINKNPNLEKIYLGFSYHNISSYYDEYIYGKYSKDIIPRYFDILPDSEKQKYLPNKLWSFYKNYLKIKLIGTKTGYVNQFNNTSAVEKSMNKRINFQYYNTKGELKEFSELNIKYLKKIRDLVLKENIQLVLLDIPVHTYYKERIPKEYKQKYNEIVGNNQFNSLNFEEITLDNDCFILDGDHLSAKGATKLSSFLLRKIP